MHSDVTIYFEPQTYEAIRFSLNNERTFETITKVVQHRLVTNVYLPKYTTTGSGPMSFVTSREVVGDIDNKEITVVEWFVGAYVARRVSQNYCAFFIVGGDPPVRTAERIQSSFLQMENDAKEIYNTKLLGSQNGFSDPPVGALDKIIYGMPTDSIPNFRLKLTTSENGIH